MWVGSRGGSTAAGRRARASFASSPRATCVLMMLLSSSPNSSRPHPQVSAHAARATLGGGGQQQQGPGVRCGAAAGAGGGGHGGGGERRKKMVVQQRRRGLRSSPLAPGEHAHGMSPSRAVFNDEDTSTHTWQNQGGWNDANTSYPPQISVENPRDQVRVGSMHLFYFIFLLLRILRFTPTPTPTHRGDLSELSSSLSSLLTVTVQPTVCATTRTTSFRRYVYSLQWSHLKRRESEVELKRRMNEWFKRKRRETLGVRTRRWCGVRRGFGPSFITQGASTHTHTPRINPRRLNPSVSSRSRPMKSMYSPRGPNALLLLS